MENETHKKVIDLTRSPSSCICRPTKKLKIFSPAPQPPPDPLYLPDETKEPPELCNPSQQPMFLIYPLPR